MNVTWKDYAILALGALLVGALVAPGTHFRYDIVILGIGVAVATALLLLAHFVLSGVKSLSLILLFVLLAFGGAVLSTWLFTKLGV